MQSMGRLSMQCKKVAVFFFGGGREGFFFFFFPLCSQTVLFMFTQGSQIIPKVFSKNMNRKYITQLKTILNLHYKKYSRSFMQYDKFEPPDFSGTMVSPAFFCWLNIAKIKFKTIKLIKSCGFLSFSTMLYLYMVQVSSQKYKRMFLRNLLSYLAFSQIWLNLPVDHSHFGCNTKIAKIAKK